MFTTLWVIAAFLLGTVVGAKNQKITLFFYETWRKIVKKWKDRVSETKTPE